jgi:plasmid stabilization system protein ParE
MKAELSAEAEQELLDAFAHYAGQSLAVAEHFIAAYEAAVLRICELPKAHPPLKRGTRRYLMPRFPYQVVYRIEGETIRIYAVAHVKRRPGYWAERLTR